MCKQSGDANWGKKSIIFCSCWLGKKSAVFENLVMSGGIPWCQVGVRGVPIPRGQGGHFRATRGSKAASGGRLEDPRESRVMSKVTHRINSNN